MSVPSSPPRLQKWPFVIADGAFLATAWLVADQSARPLGFTAALLVAGAVAAAAICGMIPFLLDYARRQDAALDERQRSLEALGRTVETAAEQIGIAASGLHQVAELAQRTLKHAEQMPARFREELAELEARLASLREDDREELEREVATLRASEGERLESAAERIAKASADWSKAETAAAKHTVALKQVLAALDERIALTGAARPGRPAGAATGSPGAEGTTPEPTVPAAATTAAPGPAQAAEAKASRTPPANNEAAPPASTHQHGAHTAAELAATVAHGNGQSEDETSKAAAAVTAPPSASARQRPASAKRRKREDDPEAELFPPAPSEATQEGEPAEPVVSTSADGATRLLVRSYIGIGNRLFIRGDGPGLSWDEGVPLQFVSIGRWRWETSEATAPIRFKLLRNDRDECANPPALPPLEPGCQQELTATF